MHKMTFLAGYASIFLLLATLGALFVVVVPVAASPEIRGVPTPYPTIQDAINAANPGDIIEVASNTYYEHVVVNKSVTLVGESSNTTIIDGSGTETVVRVTADNINVTGFTIQNGGGSPYCGLFIGSCTGSIISNNLIRKNWNGLELLGTNGGNVVANTITDNSYAGIHLSGGSSNTIRGNTIAANNVLGAWISSAVTPSTFYHNNFINNTNQVLDYGYSKWDNSVIGRGNFWSDYVGNDTNSDGIGDTPYNKWGIVDNFPLMNPYQDIAPPVADAGPDQSVFQGTTVTFDGNGSHDDVGIKSYVWAFVDVMPKNLTGVSPTYRFKHVGNFTVTLNVTDYADKWDIDTMWVNVSADTTKPSIGTVFRVPEVPGDGEKVTITVDVTDGESEVRNVTISYRTNSGPWTNVSMSKLTGTTWQGEIPGLPAGTNVTYKIIAYDNAENFEVDDNAGQYYVYTVVPEFPAAIVLLLFIIATLVAAFLRRRKIASES